MDESIFSDNVLRGLQEEYKRVLPDREPFIYELKDGKYHSFNNFIIIPIIAVKKSIDLKDHPCVSIKLSNGIEIATLCLVTERSEELRYVGGFSDEELFACFVDSHGVLEASTYSFKRNYVAVKKDFYEEYIDVMHSSEYWGGFTHEYLEERKVEPITEITALTGITAPTENHKNSMLLAIDTSSSFERFLKYYHQLELLFDVVIICKLKSLNSLNLNSYSTIIKEVNGKSELKGLHYLFENFIGDEFVAPIAFTLSKVVNNTHVAKGMFQDLGKTDNPIPDESSWNCLLHLFNENDFNSQNCNSFTMPDGSNIKLMKGNDFKKFVLHLSAYWIYRVRCSIAHNRIGEYLFEYDNEPFITDFMEHLLLKVVQAISSNQDLKNILTVLPSSSN